MGNCGFAVAPTRPEHRDTIVRTFENVEGMSAEALDEGIDWCFETFPEYLDAIDQRAKRINVGAFVGHSTLRLFVLGGDERAATDDEVATMKALLREAIDAGAVGFSTLAPTEPPGRVRASGAEPVRGRVRDRRARPRSWATPARASSRSRSAPASSSTSSPSWR